MLSFIPRHRIKTLIFILLSVLSGIVHATVEKSPNDLKQYRSLVLDNQLRVLLISNPATDKAAAAMNVAVGSSANPEDRAGLAHFLEHMLFLGTKKYPQADEYQNFIRSHGGGHNAYTAQENTNYFFDIQANDLEPALDRFAQFFIAPLFNEKYVDRERHAVHSEYQAKIRDDYRRSYAVVKSQMNQENSYNRFAVGSLETLSDREGSQVRDELIAFYNQYYSANLMSLVILGKESLDELEALARNKFSAVKNHDVQPFRTRGNLFRANQLPQKIEIKTIKDIRTLSLTFPIPETRTHWQNKPVYYISSQIGYEGKSSLLSMLKNQGWATALSASQGHNLYDQATFMINVQLTKEGYSHYLDVTQSIFQFVELLKKEGIKKALFDEEKQLSAISFRFKEESEPIHLVSGLAQMMQYYPTDKVISAQYYFASFEQELIADFLSYIRPETMQLVLKSPSIEGKQTEPYYDVPYNAEKLTARELEQLQPTAGSSQLAVRQINPFVAEHLELIASGDDKKPHLLSQENGLVHWHQQDTSFGTPKTSIYFTLQTPVANRSARSWVLNNLYIDMLQEQLVETSYDAYMAGLNSQIYPHMKGFTVRISGYSDKISLLLQTIVDAIRNTDIDAQRFNIKKQKYLDDLANALNDKPYNQTTNRLYELLLPQWSNSQQRAALQALQPADLKAFSEQLLDQPDIKILTHGNHSAASALKLEALITSQLKQKTAKKAPAIQVARIPKNQALVDSLTIEHNDSAISVLLQGEDNRLQSRAESAVLSELLASPFYNQVRTEKQLGYIVFATPLQMHKTPGIAFIIQSPVTSADQLKTEIDSFLQQWSDKLMTLDEATLARFKTSVTSRILKKDNTLSSRSKRYWREIDWNETSFDSREELAKAVDNLTLEQVRKGFEKLKARKLVVLHNGNTFAPSTYNGNLTAVFSQLKKDKKYVPES
ncbi:MAG: peptidase M16 [Neptuniibacter caesariensis]|uniref:Protease 3 n=1 Tax=Neptuniibacter caesariensis TaxID=207954 RepID=A0A2G6JPD1_NEPCE|nr:MAG: peptidase M16 [Neptuniibacter caesariensis]